MSRVFDALKNNVGPAVDRVSGLWEVLDTALPKAEESAPVANEEVSLAAMNVPELEFERRAEHRLVCLDSQGSQAAENIRILAAKLRYLKKQRPFEQLLISSSVNGEGKSMIAANLAITLAAKEGEPTLLIDGDFPHRTLTRMFNASGEPGLVQWLGSGEPVSRFVRRMDNHPLFFLPAGQDTKDYSLRAEQVAESMAAIKGAFDWIIVDAAPLTILADTSAWVMSLEKSLIVTRAGVTPKKMLQKGLTSLPKGKLLGVVLNEYADAGQNYYERHYGHRD